MVNLGSTSKSLGSCGQSGTIYISAKRRYQQVCGTIVHELAHFAMLKIYENQWKPFRLADVGREQEFADIIAECRKFYKNEPAGVRSISSVFKSYSFDNCAGELIARVPQILINLIEAKRKLELTITTYSKLFEFYSKYVVVDIDLALEDLLVKEQK